MSDITGDAFTIHAAEKIEKAIEHVGYTSSQQQVGKAIQITKDGAKLADADTDRQKFIGVVKAVTSEAEGSFAKTKVLGNPVTGANPTYAPYYLGDVTVLEGQGLTVERNCISYVLAKAGENIEFGDPIACGDDGLFVKGTDDAKIVGRSYSNQVDNRYDVIRVRINAY